MGTVGATATVGKGTGGVIVGGMKVGITAVSNKGTMGVGKEMFVVGATTTRPTVAKAARVGANGVGVGDSDPHPLNHKTANKIISENGRFLTYQFIKQSYTKSRRVAK